LYLRSFPRNTRQVFINQEINKKISICTDGSRQFRVEKPQGGD